MKRLYKLTERLYDKKIDASGLAVFRVAYGVVLLCEVIQLYYFRHLIFDKIPFIEPSDIDLTPALIMWMITIVFLIFGLFTRQVAIINYLFSIVFIATISSYEYHMFYVYMSVNFLLMFVNVSQVGSLDRLRLKLKYSNTRVTYIPSRKVSVLNYYVIILLAVAFVYFDSVFFKFVSPLWLHGLGLWLPASLPQNVWSNVSPLLNLKYFVLGLGYLTMFFEAVFPFTFFRKKCRIPLLIIGIGLHIGILIIFPLPWFGAGVIGVYLLMIPVRYWRKIKNKMALKSPKLFFYYDEECPLCIRTKIILSYFDWFKAIEFKGVQTYGFNNELLQGIDKEELLKNIYSTDNKGNIFSGVYTYRMSFKYIPFFSIIGLFLYIPGVLHLAKWVYAIVAKNRNVERCTEDNCGYVPPNFPTNVDTIKLLTQYTIKDFKVMVILIGIVIFSLLQANVTYNSAMLNSIKQKTGITNSHVGVLIDHVSQPVMAFSKKSIGITTHAVFMDYHFNGYKHIIGIQAQFPNGEKKWLPIIDENGTAGSYLSSFNWVKWTFRVNAPHINQADFIKGSRDFCTFWAYKNKYPLNAIRFNVYLKKIDEPHFWIKNFINNQIAHSWELIGTMFWDNNNFVANIPDMQSL